MWVHGEETERAKAKALRGERKSAADGALSDEARAED